MAAPYSRLPPLPALRDFIHIYRLRAKKILSQNYIMDMNINRKIVRAARVKPGDVVCEVGPGPGGITRGILEAGCSRLDVVEIDHRFLPPLQHLAEASDGRMNIHHGDILKTDVGEIWKTIGGIQTTDWYHEPPDCHIIGNLPFNIATPLIIKYLRDISYRRGPWKFGRAPLTLTFQLEVAKRICSPIASVSRSRISIVSQYLTEPQLLFTISGSCFVPKPEVDVGVVRFVPREQPLINSAFEVVEKLCRQVFHYRQKHMIKGLMTLYPEQIAHEKAHELLAVCRIDPTTTSIRLGIEQFADLAVGYEKQCRDMPGLFLYDYTRKKRTVEMLKDDPNALPPDCPHEKTLFPREGLKLSQIS